MDEDMNVYITKCKMFIQIMLRNQLWSGLSMEDINRWVLNFQELDIKEQAVFYRLLTNIIYFSENDIINLLEDGIRNKLFNNVVLEKQIKYDFQLSRKAISNIVGQELDKTCFIPLLASNSPHESGNAVSRDLVQQGIIYQKQSIFLDYVAEAIKDYHYTHIVIVDDCLGSGDQLKRFWNKTAKVNVESNKLLLKDWAKLQGIDVIYLVLFGYQESIDQLQGVLDNIKICCLKKLDKTLKVFAEDSYIWGENDEERLYSLEIIKNHIVKKGVKLFGYKDLDFALIMHKTIPNWSLPLFWSETVDWKCLLRRKDTGEFAK